MATSLTCLMFHLGWLGWLGAAWSGHWVTIWHLVLHCWAGLLVIPCGLRGLALQPVSQRLLIGWLVSPAGRRSCGIFKVPLELASITSAVFFWLNSCTPAQVQLKEGCTKALISGNGLPCHVWWSSHS